MHDIPRISVRLLTAGVVALVRIYQFTISPLLGLLFGSQCRFYPSCSQYMILAVRKHGLVRGTARGMWRVCRCNPWSTGGYDLP
jgi:hypothetical protein